MSAPARCARVRYVWSSVFFAPKLQPTSHSPQRRHVLRCIPCSVRGPVSATPASGSAPGDSAKLTARFTSRQPRPVTSAASRKRRVLGVVSAHGYGVAPSSRSTAS